MKRLVLLVCILAVSLSVGMVTTHAAGLAQPQDCLVNNAKSPQQVLKTGENSYVLVQSGQAYEVLRGSRALTYLANKRLQHPQRFMGMGGALASAGYRPTDTIYVERSLDPEEAMDILGDRGSRLIQPRRASTTYSNWQGEQIFWSWDDGNDATWEGSQYVERYSDHAWASYDGQLDISNTNGDAIWGTKTGSGGGIDEEFQVSIPGGESRGSIRFAGFFDDVDEDFKQWALCITGGCLGCAGGCLLTGPGYPLCYGGCCFGVSITCAFNYYFGD